MGDVYLRAALNRVNTVCTFYRLVKRFCVFNFIVQSQTQNILTLQW